MRERIMIAAMEEMNELGIKFTMTDLAKRLGISKRTLYECFESKEELINAIVDTAVADIGEKRRVVFGDDTLGLVEKLRKLLTVRQTVFIQFNDRVSADIKRCMPERWKKTEAAFDKQWDMIEDLIKQGVENGYFRPVYLPVVRKMFKGAINEIIDYSFLAQHNATLNEMIEYVTDVLLFGIVSAEKQVYQSMSR